MNDIDTGILKGIANQLRIHSIEATTAAGSGHPTSCCSAADIVAALFFGHMRYDPKDPHYYNNDRFILSKGHAAPLLYAAWAETGLFPMSELLKLRQFGNDLEGYKKRFEAFGWRVEEIDGHDMDEILEVLAFVGADDKPLVILAKTLKGA